ncbi:MAG TPA: hypothetical protein VGL75_19030 [Acidothermaceae bacterium]|jgi:hypothetical protein
MVGGRRAALTVVLSIVGAVSCASATGDHGQALAPISSEARSAQPTSAPQQALPESLRAACGHPGAQAVLTAVPITAPKAQCDLTGVVVLYGSTGVTVPSEGGVEADADGISSSVEFGANVDPATGDVTFSGSQS